MQLNSLDRAFANFARRHLYRDQRIAYLGDGTSTQVIVNPTTSTIRGVWYYEKHGTQLMPKATATLVEGGGIFYENSTDNDNLEVWIGRRPFSNKTYVIRPTEEALQGWSGQTPLERKINGIVAGGGAPTNATYITQTPNGFLSAEQALSLLGTGIMAVTTGTGVISSLAIPLSVPNGGTGKSNLALNNVLLGNNAGNVQEVAPGAAGNILRSDGTTWGSWTPVKETEVDFGATPTAYKTFTITDATVTATSKIIAVQSGAAPTGKSADENEMDPIVFSVNPAAGTFTLNAAAQDGPVIGKFKVNYMLAA